MIIMKNQISQWQFLKNDMKFYLKTFGCQMNDADSEVMMKLMEREGNWKIDSPEGAAVVIRKNKN